MPTPSQPQPDTPDPEDAQAPVSPAPAAGKRANLLKVALAKTELMMTASDGELDAPLAAFREVARRYRDQPWSAERIGRAMVETGLGLSFDRAAFGHREWERLVGAVSTALFEDQVSLDRCRAFWDNLVTAVQE